MLSTKFEILEVKEAIFSMNPFSSLGLDRFSVGFFQQHWDSIGKKICEVVTKVVNNNRWDSSINKTFIVLIPNAKNPTIVAEFWPISLCKVLYKIMANVLANIMKITLPEIISQTQSEFFPGRFIADNIIVVVEVLHTMQCKMKGPTRCMALKLDMSKAYDILEWNFIEAVMTRMGFNRRCIDLIYLIVLQ